MPPGRGRRAPCHGLALPWVTSRAASRSSQAPSEYETSPDQLFYRIAHLNRGQQYLLWVAAVTSAGRGNISEKVTIEPAGKGTAGPGCSRTGNTGEGLAASRAQNPLPMSLSGLTSPGNRVPGSVIAASPFAAPGWLLAGAAGAAGLTWPPLQPLPRSSPSAAPSPPPG